MRPEFPTPEGAFKWSASQDKTFHSCQRKWWFSRLLKDESSSYGHVFGKVLHSVLERELIGEDPFPKGWTIDPETDEQVTAEDAELIRTMLRDAIEQGILVREPGLEVERMICHPMDTDEGGPVWLVGFVDVTLPHEIQDHKGTKSLRWALTSEQLAEDTQLLLYCAEKFLKTPKLETLGVAHNVFVRSGPKRGRVEQRRATVTREKALERWTEVTARAKQARALKRALPTLTSWAATPPTTGDPCRAYRGCPYEDVCFSGLTPYAWKARQERLRSSSSGASAKSTTTPVGGDMTFEERMALLKGQVPTTPTTPTTPAAPTPPAAPDPINPPPVETVPEVTSEPNETRTEVSDEPATVEPVKTKKKKRTRKKKSAPKAEAPQDVPEPNLLLLRGCLPSSGKIAHTLGSVLRDVLQSDGLTLEDYYGLDAFKRRDKLAILVGRLKGKLQGTVYVPGRTTPDEAVIASALSRIADLEIVGVTG